MYIVVRLCAVHLFNTGSTRIDHFLALFCGSHFYEKLVGKYLNDIKHVQYSNPTLWMMIVVICSFVSTSRASQH